MTALLNFLETSHQHDSHQENFLLITMDTIKTNSSTLDCFKKFCEDPKDFNIDVIQGSHKFMVEVIKGKREAPSNKTLITIFGAFCSKPIKEYIFSRMGKKIMQELALCILQDLASNGPERAKTLQLEVEKASSGGKRVKIADNFDDGKDPIDQSFLEEIDAAIFKFKDQSGASPDIKISAGQGLAAPYQPPSSDGAFVTPTKKHARSIQKEIEVKHATASHNFCAMSHSASSHTYRPPRLRSETLTPNAMSGTAEARYNARVTHQKHSKTQ